MMKNTFSTRFWISTFLIGMSFQLVAQDKAIVDSFLNRLKNEYDQFNLVYLNDRIQVKEFIVTDEYVILMDERKNNKGKKGSYFYLFDRQNMIALDTLTLDEVSPTFDEGLSVNQQNVYYRPRTGVLDNYAKKTFYGSLTLQFSTQQNTFGPLNIHEDDGTQKADIFLHFSDAKNFQRWETKKTIAHKVNDNIRTYRFKDLPASNIAKRSQYKYLFPSVVTAKGLMLLDGVSKKLIVANQNKADEKTVVLPIDFNRAISNQLLHDDKTKRLYLRLTFKEDEKIYELKKGEFQPVGLDLPKGFNKISSGITYKRALFINGGQLYLILTINEDGKSYDGLFRADL